MNLMISFRWVVKSVQVDLGPDKGPLSPLPCTLFSLGRHEPRQIDSSGHGLSAWYNMPTTRVGIILIFS